MDDSLVFAFDAASRRYTAHRGETRVAFIDADPIGPDALLIKHTEVDPAEEGKGYASALLRHVLDDARSKSRKVIPICPYANGYIAKHPEYHDLVRK